MNKGRALKPNTARDTLMKQLFDEQERLNVSNYRLGKLSAIHPVTIAKLRHPEGSHGKHPTLNQVRAIAEALDFIFPERLRKHGDH